MQGIQHILCHHRGCILAETGCLKKAKGRKRIAFGFFQEKSEEIIR